MGNNHRDESKTSEYARSAQLGMLKEGLDRGVRKISDPLVKAFSPVIGKVTDSDMTDPAMQMGLEFAVMQVVAEALLAGSVVADKIPGIDLSEKELGDRMDALSRLVRGYSSERLGDAAARKAVEFLPLVKNLFNTATLAGLFDKSSSEEMAKLPPAGATAAPSIFDLLGGDNDQNS